MNTRDFEDVLKSLLDDYCPLMVGLDFTHSVYDWCRENDHDVIDRAMPLKLVVDERKGCRLVVNEVIPQDVIESRINAVSVRGALHNVAHNPADRLDSEKKKLAFLFLSEYGSALPEHEDEHDVDSWAFQQMELLGMFKE